MQWNYLKRIFLVYVFLLPTAFSQELLRFSELPVQWQAAEHWQWQGQELSSQRFSSEHDIVTVTQQIQKHAHGVDLRVQRLASAWLLSFDHVPTQTHYLFLLSVNSQGTEGWFSTLRLPNGQNTITAQLPAALFTGLYQNSWSLADIKEKKANEPFYALLQPISSSLKVWQELNQRLSQQAWRGGSCYQGQWCQWHKDSQKLWLWEDPKLGLWHVLWWPNLLRVRGKR